MPLVHLFAHHDHAVDASSSSHGHHHGHHDTVHTSFYRVVEHSPPKRLATDTGDEWFIKEANSMKDNLDTWSVKKMLLATKTEYARRRAYHLLYGQSDPPMVMPQHPLTKAGWEENMYLSTPFSNLPKYMQDQALKVAPLPLNAKQFDWKNLYKIKQYYDAHSGLNSMRNVMGSYVSTFFLQKSEVVSLFVGFLV